LQQRPDGALLDVGLREGNCVDVANLLRKLSVPFVVLTAHPQETLPKELRNAPYIGKPTSEGVLLQAARQMFH
jgi:DNA-binding response OmpR family regulator